MGTGRQGGQKGESGKLHREVMSEHLKDKQSSPDSGEDAAGREHCTGKGHER